MAANEYIYANLSTREATGSTGSPLTFSFVAGQSVSYALRFLQRDSAGALGETGLDILNLRAAIGREGAWPEGGWYKIKVGTAPSTAANTTERIDFNAGALDVEEALNALTGKPAEFRCDEGAHAILIRRVDGGEVALSVVPDGLRPTSFGKILGGRRFPERKARLSLGGANGLTFLSKLEGEAGNGISVQYVPSTILSVSVVGNKITVNLGSSATSATIKTAVEASAAASALVGVAILGTGLAPAAGQAETFLSGGMNPSGYEYSLQLAQAPVVFTDWTTRNLPPAPVITKIQSGGRINAGIVTTVWNTIQALAVPPDFRGAYQFKRGLKRSALASKDDGTVAITRILNALLAEEGGTVTVTNPNNNVAHIEFGGTFAGYDIADLEISVYSTPPPDYVFSLDLGSADLAEVLQDRESVTLPFEVDATVWEDPNDPTLGTKVIKLWKTTATIRRNVLWDALAVRPPIDWQRKPMPVDYVPFSDTQFLVGQQAAYTTVIGNGSAKNFSINHGLGGGVEQVGQSYIYKDEGVVSVDVRENKPSGRQLRDDEYVLRFVSAGSVSLEFSEAPEEDGLVVVVLGYGQESAFTIHTHPIDQIKSIGQSGETGESLRVILEDFQERIARLERLIPRGSVSSLGSGLEKKKVQIPPIGEILPDIAMEGADGEPLSLASQIIAPDTKGKPPTVVANTELEEQKKLFDADLLRVKAEAAAELKAAQDAAARAAQELKVKADQEAAQKKTSIISRVAIAEFANRGTGATPSTTPLPNLYPAMRNGKYAWLLPAIHSAAAQDTTTLPTLAAATGNVYRNTGTAPIALPGGGGRKGQSVPVNGFFGSDGRAIYALRRAGTTTSYHPIEMERELVRLVVRAAQFPLGSDLSLAWQLDLSFLTDSVAAGAGYLMPVEVTPLVSATTPATTGTNVGALGQPVLVAAPRIGFSRGISETRQFSLKLARLINEAGQSIGRSAFMDYGVESIGPEFDSGDFLLTVRLAQWDVDDSTPSPTGLVSVLMPATQMTVEQTL